MELLQQRLCQFYSLLHQSIFRSVIKLLALWALAGRPNEDAAALEGRDPADSVKLASLVTRRELRMHGQRESADIVTVPRLVVCMHDDVTIYSAELQFA